jgi:hypothetical protein
VKLRLTIDIDPNILRRLEDQALKSGTPLEALIARRLTTCVDHVATKPLFFSDTQRQDLEKTLGRNLASPDEAITAIKQALSLSLDGRQLQFKPDLLYRLQGRNLAKVPFADFVEKTATEELERYCEMR